MKKVQTEAKTSEKHIVAEWDGALSRFHGVLRTIRRIIKAGVERNAGHADTSTQPQLLFVEKRKVKAVSPLTSPSQEGP